MADVQHASLTSPSLLHEPKGAAAAAANHVYIADGAGSGSFGAPKIDGQTAAAVDTVPVSDGAGAITWQSKLAKMETVLDGQDATAQAPTAVDTLLQVKFGPAISATEFTLDAAGALTCLVTGDYLIQMTFRFGRTTGTGTAQTVLRYLIDGVVVGNSVSAVMGTAAEVIPYGITAPFTMTAGQVLTVEIIRDSSGANDGGLYAFTPTPAGWNVAPSALVRISKARIGT